MSGLTWTKGHRPQDAGRTSLGGLTGTVQMSRIPGATSYDASGGFDEAFDSRGAPRELYRELLATLAGADLEELRGSVAGELETAGVEFGEGESSATFPLDPIPRLLSAAEWSLLERGLAQRVRALGAFIRDAYGERAIVADGRIPARVIDSADHFEPWMAGVAVSPAGCVAGLDLVRGADGALRVLEDNIRTPSGIAYMAAVRTALDSHLACGDPSRRLDPGRAFDMLGDALRAAAPDGRGDPSVALLSDGPANSAWWEHEEIARRLDIPIVSRERLLVRRGRLHAVLDDSRTRELQVVYRRTDEDRLRERDGTATWLADALLAPCRNGTLSVVNPFGAGVADDKLAHAYVDEMVSFYLGEDPLVPSVKSYDLGDPEVLDSVMPRLGELVVKPRTGHGGAGVVVCPHATDEDRRSLAEKVRSRPEEWIAQEMVQLSTHPTVCDGALAPRHVDLRPFVIGSGEAAAAVPGALTRVSFDAGALVVNSSQNGGGKDTWVLK